MSERDQPFYRIASNDNQYQAIEQAFVAALVEDNQGQYELAQQRFLMLLAKLQSRAIQPAKHYLSTNYIAPSTNKLNIIKQTTIARA